MFLFCTPTIQEIFRCILPNRCMKIWEEITIILAWTEQKSSKANQVCRVSSFNLQFIFAGLHLVSSINWFPISNNNMVDCISPLSRASAFRINQLHSIYTFKQAATVHGIKVEINQGLEYNVLVDNSINKTIQSFYS